jgi:ComEC/Rec2-related protein
MRQRHRLQCIAASLLIGLIIGCAPLVSIRILGGLIIFFVGLLFTAITRRQYLLILVMLTLLLMGVARSQVQVRSVGWVRGEVGNKPVELIGETSGPAIWRFDQTTVTMNVVSPEAVAAIQVTLDGIHEVFPGDQLAVRCRLRPLEMPATGADRAVLAAGATARCAAGTVRTHDVGDPSVLRSLAYAQRWVILRHQAVFEHPRSALASGLFVGADQALLPAERAVLRDAGLLHLTALSGYNLMLIYGVVLSIARTARLSRHIAEMVGIGLMVGFVCMTGAPSSVVRACILTIVGLLALRGGGRTNPALSLLYTAVLIGMWQPLRLWFDAGLHLSFAATMGIVFLSKGFGRALSRFFPAGFAEQVSLSAAAGWATSPVTIMAFGSVSMIGALATIATGPLTTVSTGVATLSLVLPSALATHPIGALLLQLPLQAIYIIAALSAEVPLDMQDLSLVGRGLGVGSWVVLTWMLRRIMRRTARHR